MPSPILAIDGLFGLVTAAIFAYIGWTLARRPVGGEGRSAVLAFATWWHGMAVSTALGSVTRILAGMDLLGANLYETVLYLTLLPLCAALWGLLYYLLYLLTGSAALRVPLAIAYGGFYAILLGFVVWGEPDGFVAEGVRLGANFTSPQPGWALRGIILLMVVPLIGGALGYLSLVRRVPAPEQKYRIWMVSGSVLAWFGSALLASEVGLSNISWWPIASRIIGLTAAATILLAYRPPLWLQRRLGFDQGREQPRGAT